MSDLENTSNNEAVNPNDALCTIEMINYQGAREEIDIWGRGGVGIRKSNKI